MKVINLDNPRLLSRLVIVGIKAEGNYCNLASLYYLSVHLTFWETFIDKKDFFFTGIGYPKNPNNQRR